MSDGASNEDEAVAFATKVLDTMGSTEALLMAMRLTLMVGQHLETRHRRLSRPQRPDRS